MSHLYLAHWEWDTTSIPDEPRWRGPNGESVSCLDLRSIPQRARAGGPPEGVGLFSYTTPQSSPLILSDLGTDIEANLSVPQKNAIKSGLGLSQSTPIEDTPLQIIRQIFLDPAYYDPTGQTKGKPLRGSKLKGTYLYLKGFTPDGFIFKEPLSSLIEDSTLAVFRADYMRNRNFANGLPLAKKQVWLDTMNRMVGHEMRKLYGTMSDSLADSILPDLYKGDGWAVPRTTIGDTFVEASDTDLSAHTATGPNGGFGWENVAGTTASWVQVKATPDNAQTTTTANLIRRVDSGGNLSGDEHHCQTDVSRNGGASGSRVGAVCTRMASAADTEYVGLLQANGTTAEIVERTAGSDAQLTTTSHAFDIDTVYVIRLTSDSADLHQLVIDASDIINSTDTSITGNVQTGIRGRNADSPNDIIWDDFEAADIVAASGGLFLPHLYGQGVGGPFFQDRLQG